MYLQVPVLVHLLKVSGNLAVHVHSLVQTVQRESLSADDAYEALGLA